MAAAASAPVLLPALVLGGYARRDECGDLGSLGAGIFGWLLGLLAFGAAVTAASVALRRARVVLVVPVVVLLHFALAEADPQWPPMVALCAERVSLFVPALLAAVGGGLTYALGGGAGRDR